jgi:hypothetical protein
MFMLLDEFRLENYITRHNSLKIEEINHPQCFLWYKWLSEMETEGI